tara:strand:- start:602 stop:754 length:153 start_codon:yes stop_codon:yes gene_type:complete
VDKVLECQEITVIKHTVEMQADQLTSQEEAEERYTLTTVLVTVVDRELVD